MNSLYRRFIPALIAALVLLMLITVPTLAFRIMRSLVTVDVRRGRRVDELQELFGVI